MPGRNPPSGAVIDYYLSSAPAAPVTLEITDSQGQVVHHSVSEAAAAKARSGWREAVRWARGAGEASQPMRWVEPVRLELSARWSRRSSGDGDQRNEPMGPMVPPGTYQVKLTVAGKDYATPLIVKPDPRVKVSQADFDKQYEFAVKLRDRVTEVHTAVNAIRAARASLEQQKKADPSKAQAIDAIEQTMAEIEGQLIQVASVTRWASLVLSDRARRAIRRS